MHLFKLRPGVTSVSVDGVEYKPEADGLVHIETPSLKVIHFLSTEGHRPASDEDFTDPAVGSEEDEKTALLARIEAAGGKADRRRSLANLRYIAAELEGGVADKAAPLPATPPAPETA